MNVRDTFGIRALVAALAFGGVLAGHVIAYAGHRAHAHTGGAVHAHGYLPGLATVVLPLAAAALVAVAAAELRTGERIVSMGRLAALQVTLFTAAETLERVAAGGTPAGLVDERALWAGLAAQVAIAGSLVAAVRWVGRAVRPLRAPVSMPISSLPGTARRIPATGRPRVCDRFEPRSRRGPPAVVAA